jgi:hypothetical protein
MSAAKSQISLIGSTSRGWWRVIGEFLSIVTLSVVLSAPCSGTAQTAPPRQPVGIYDRLTIQGGTDTQISNNIAAALTNPAISGILGVFQWSDLNPTPMTNSLFGTNDWRTLDDLFNDVAQWNADNPTKIPKTIQLEITPGFHTPQWVFNNLSNCDAMFLTNPQGAIATNDSQENLVLVGVDTTNVATDSGYATFLEAENHVNPTVIPLPLPWNPFYKNAWKSFIQAVAGRYETNTLMVSVAVAGPTASSAEMILPNEINDPTNYLKWNPIFALEFPNDPSLTNSDMKFIKEWEDAIDVYGNAFSNLTLVATTGMGLPNFLMTNGLPYTNYTVPPGFAPDCCNTNNQARLMDCAAETTILAYFLDPQHGGNNAKAVQEDGFSAGAVNNAFNDEDDLDSHAMKWLAENTASGTAPLPGSTNILSRVLGGLQMGGNGGAAIITQNPDTEGCPDPVNDCTNISPEQAIYYVFAAYFDGTPAGSNYGIPPIILSSNMPLNYLQIYNEDITYANVNTNPVPVINGFGITNYVTAQMLFSNASSLFSGIAEFDLGLNVQMAGQTVQLNWLATTPTNYQLQVSHKLTDPNGWNPATQTPTFVGDYYQVSLAPTAAASFFRLAPP